MSIEIKENAIVVAKKTVEKDHITAGHSYRVLEDSEAEEKTVLIRCADWGARQIKKTLLSIPQPKQIKK